MAHITLRITFKSLSMTAKALMTGSCLPPGIVSHCFQIPKDPCFLSPSGHRCRCCFLLPPLPFPLADSLLNILASEESSRCPDSGMATPSQCSHGNEAILPP